MTPWIWILVGGVFETVWALSMKMSDGFSNIPWTIVTLVFIFLSVYFLNSGMKRGLPVGGGYAVWVGVGAIGSIVMGIILFGESIAPMRLIFAALIVVGIVGVELTCKPGEGETECKR